MSKYLRTLMIALTVLLMAAGTAAAVGYETRDTAKPGVSSPKAPSGYTFSGAYRAIKDATFVEKYPAVLDEAAAAIKTLLSQFGIVGYQDSKQQRSAR